VYLHRLIVEAPAGAFVDHIDRNTKDNRRLNLRLATCSQNSMNQVRRRSLLYRGVRQRADCDGFCARISVNNKYIHLGSFSAEKDAAIAYDAAALKYHGEFAVLNFPLEAKAQ
jgi:hypothetical protein